jgi:DegV family protein with EDD domain
MPGVRVVTDSASDLSEEQAAANDVRVVPLTIRFGGEELLDRIELSPEEFWRRCRQADQLPETAAPSPGAFQQAFTEAAEAGADAVVCITLSSGVSATYQSACAAAEAVRDRCRVEVVDSRFLTMGQGLLVLAAAEAARAGADVETIVTQTQRDIRRTRVLGVVGTLEHLQKGGRIGGAAALVGSLLSIKPVIEVRDGKVAEESKQRTRSRALSYLAQKVRADAPLDRLAICNGASDDIASFSASLEGVDVRTPVVTVELGPVVGTHAGPATVGVCYMLPAPSTGPDD